MDGVAVSSSRRTAVALLLCAMVCMDPAVLARGPAGDTGNQKRGKNDTAKRSAEEPKAEKPRAAEPVEVTRPRRAAFDNRSEADREPRIRVGLLIDASAVSITSATGLLARRPDSPEEEEADFAGEDVRVQVEQRTTPVRRRPVYRIEAATATSQPQAKQISTEIRKKLNQNAAVSYDRQKRTYRITLGPVDDMKQADEMVARLRRSGYSRARVEAEQTAEEPSRSPLQTISTRGGASTASRDAISAPRLTARRGDHIIASDETVIVFSAASRAQFASFSAKPISRSTHARTRQEEPPATVKVGRVEYRGEIHLLLNRRGRINVVNVLPLEEYLRGVVPLELSPRAFPEMEALKAQAIAARTYALSQRGRYGAEGFDVRDDARSQVYGGRTAEHAVTNRAVEETRGLVAVYREPDGRVVPIEAVYTSTCGGRTENNEAVFLTNPVPYLRSVVCAVDDGTRARQELRTGRDHGAVASLDGGGREVALFEVLGFKLPRRLTAQYLNAVVDPEEIADWAEHAARLVGRQGVSRPRVDPTSLSGFASVIGAVVYGNERPGALLSPADVDYILAGLGLDNLPAGSRAELASLVSAGVLRLPPRGSKPYEVTRSYAAVAFVRAVEGSGRASILETGTVAAVDSGRVVIEGKRGVGESAGSKRTLEVDRLAWLFRRYGSDSYAADRVSFVGGERITFHIGVGGRVDFLEVEASARGASSDRFSSAWRWQQQLSAREIERRLRLKERRLGRLVDLVPAVYGASNRLVELEVVGTEGRTRLKGSQIRNGLGLKENLFVIDRRLDDKGQVTSFLFSGRGWGHGVGMCQVGAYGLARAGYSFEAILKKYYTGVDLAQSYF